MICPDPCRHRTRYRFAGTSEDGQTYIWYSVRPRAGDGRVERITCTRNFFWGE